MLPFGYLQMEFLDLWELEHYFNAGIRLYYLVYSIQMYQLMRELV